MISLSRLNKSLISYWQSHDLSAGSYVPIPAKTSRWLTRNSPPDIGQKAEVNHIIPQLRSNAWGLSIKLSAATLICPLIQHTYSNQTSEHDIQGKTKSINVLLFIMYLSARQCLKHFCTNLRLNKMSKHCTEWDRAGISLCQDLVLKPMLFKIM